MEIDMFDDHGFKHWMEKVDHELTRECGLGSSDLADQCYADMFEDGLNPRDVAHEVLESEGYYYLLG